MVDHAPGAIASPATIKELTMSLRNLGLTAALLVSSLGAFWAPPASASCQVCLYDLQGNKHCFDICLYNRDWWWMPPDAKLHSPLDIAPIVRDLQTFLRDPSPQPYSPESGTWMMLNPSSQRAFIVDLKNATLTEVVSGEQALAR
jgi:hypothetical protein